jgi:hypothetical protein
MPEATMHENSDLPGRVVKVWRARQCLYIGAKAAPQTGEDLPDSSFGFGPCPTDSRHEGGAPSAGKKREPLPLRDDEFPMARPFPHVRFIPTGSWHVKASQSRETRF